MLQDETDGCQLNVFTFGWQLCQHLRGTLTNYNNNITHTWIYKIYLWHVVYTSTTVPLLLLLNVESAWRTWRHKYPTQHRMHQAWTHLAWTSNMYRSCEGRKALTNCKKTYDAVVTIVSSSNWLRLTKHKWCQKVEKVFEQSPRSIRQVASALFTSVIFTVHLFHICV